MTTKLQNRAASHVVFTALLAVLLNVAHLAGAQAAASSHFLGTITAVNGTSITVKTDAGEVHQVDVPETAVLKQIPPGEKDLTKAAALAFADLATGDRVLVTIDPKVTEGTPQALRIIAIKQADLAKKQAAERLDWQQRGVGGLVKSVDSAAGVIVITSGAGPMARTITIHATKATVLKRYAAASVRFDLAQPGPIDAIQPGDQLRARGAKSADGSSIDAEEIVSGGFRNVSGLITSVDPATSTIVVKDLATKKPVTIHITPDAQMHKLPDQMATFLGAFLKSGAGQAGGGQAAGARRTGGRASDPQAMLNSTPVIQFADLKKGDAVMLVSTQGASEVTAITLVAGVEPLLEAPAASNLLANWSMGSGAPDVGQ